MTSNATVRDLNVEIAEQSRKLKELKKEQKAEQSKAQKARAKKVAEYAKYRHFIKSGEYLFREVWDFESYCEQCGWNDAKKAEHFGSLSLAQNAAKTEQLATIYDMLGLTDKQRDLYNSWVKHFKEELEDDV
jgi:hypothetical protein